MATGKHFKPEASRPSQPLPVIPATQARGSRTAGGRHSATQPGQRVPRRYAMMKPLVMAALVLAVVGVAVSGVIAWLSTTSSVSNTFELGTVKPTVQETFENDTKSNVFIKNKGNVPIYVRAQVNIYWVDADGNQLWDQPVADTDYTLKQNLDGTKWVKSEVDGFYYWAEPLAAGDQTTNLIDSLTWNDPGNGRTLVCDIAVQGIQAEPAEAVQEAWGVTIENGTVTPVTTTEGAGE